MPHRDARGRFTTTSKSVRELFQTHEPIFADLVESWRQERPRDLALIAAHVRIPDVEFAGEDER